MEVISSLQNQKIKDLQKLHQSKGRKQAGAYLIEGVHLVQEAIQSGQDIKQVVLSQSFNPDQVGDLTGQQVLLVTDQVFAKLAQAPSPQGVLAVVDIPDMKLNQAPQGRWLILDGVQDPGNLGTMIRTADAAGFDGVYLGKGTVDPWNDKVVRSMQGSQFHIPIYDGDLGQDLDLFRQAGLPIVATALSDQAVSYQHIQSWSQVALLMGNEGAGVSPEYIQAADYVVMIPQYGQAESLNVAIAAGILMYMTRQEA